MRRVSLQQSNCENTNLPTMNNDDSPLHSNSMNEQSNHESNNNENGGDLDILFGKSCGSLNHKARMAYQNTINEFVDDKIEKNPMYLTERVVRNEQEIKEIYDKVMSIDENFRWVNRSINNNNNGVPKYIFVVIDDMKTIYNKIFESIKRKKQYASNKDIVVQEFKEFMALRNEEKGGKKRKGIKSKSNSPLRKRRKMGDSQPERKGIKSKSNSSSRKRFRMGGNQPGKYTYTAQENKKKGNNSKEKKNVSQDSSTRQTRSKTRMNLVKQKPKIVKVPKVKKINDLKDIQSDDNSNNSSEKEINDKEKKKKNSKTKGRFTKLNQNNKKDTESNSSVIFDEENETNNACATVIVDSDDEKYYEKSNHNNNKDVNNNKEDETSFGGRSNSDSSGSNLLYKEKIEKTDKNLMKNPTENAAEKTDDNTLKHLSDKETENNNDSNIDGKSNDDRNNVDHNEDEEEKLFDSSTDSSSSGSNKSNKEEIKKPHQNLMKNQMKKLMETTENNTSEKSIVNEMEQNTGITIEEDMNNNIDIPTTIICGEILPPSSTVTNSTQESSNKSHVNKDKPETTVSVIQPKHLDKITNDSKLEANNDKDDISVLNKDQDTTNQTDDTIECNARSSNLNSKMDTEHIDAADVTNEKECSGNAADKEANKSPDKDKIDNEDNCKSTSNTISEEVKKTTSSNPYDPRRIPITHDLVNNYFVDNKKYKGIYSLTFRKELTDAEKDQVLSETHLRLRKFYDNSTDPIPKFNFNEAENTYVIKRGWSVGNLLKNLKRREAGVPGDGNCAITSIIAQINDLNDTNYSVLGETVVKFRKWFVYNYMKIILDPNIYEWDHIADFRSMQIIQMGLEPINWWYNEKKKDTAYYANHDQDYIQEKYWIESQTLWPFISWIFKKSIVVF